MENCSIIVPSFAKLEKILSSFWCEVTMNYKNNCSSVCYHLHITFHLQPFHLFVNFLSNLILLQLSELWFSWNIGCEASTCGTCWIEVSEPLMFIDLIFNTPFNETLDIFPRLFLKFEFFLCLNLFFFLVLFLFFLFACFVHDSLHC